MPHKLLTVPSTVSVLEGGRGTPTEVFVVLKVPKSEYALTQAEISLLRELLHHGNVMLNDFNKKLIPYREHLWNNCDKDNPDTEPAFRQLNKVKSQIKKVRRDRKIIASIFTKLKQQAKGQ